jgi:hypothetical protein
MASGIPEAIVFNNSFIKAATLRAAIMICAMVASCAVSSAH